jgi:hypothetical protein
LLQDRTKSGAFDEVENFNHLLWGENKARETQNENHSLLVC